MSLLLRVDEKGTVGKILCCSCRDLLIVKVSGFARLQIGSNTISASRTLGAHLGMRNMNHFGKVLGLRVACSKMHDHAIMNKKSS
jgi:hypothetical protein